MLIRKSLGAIVLAAALAIGGCKYEGIKPETLETKNLKGKVYQLTTQELIYGDAQTGASKHIPVSITFLGVESEDKKYQIVLIGPHNLERGDSVDLDYLVDNEITGKEIWSRFYPKRDTIFIVDPNVRFKVDGYALVWKKE